MIEEWTGDGTQKVGAPRSLWEFREGFLAVRDLVFLPYNTQVQVSKDSQKERQG